MFGVMYGKHIGWDSIIYLAALSAIDPHIMRLQLWMALLGYKLGI